MGPGPYLLWSEVPDVLYATLNDEFPTFRLQTGIVQINRHIGNVPLGSGGTGTVHTWFDRGSSLESWAE